MIASLERSNANCICMYDSHYRFSLRLRTAESKLCCISLVLHCFVTTLIILCNDQIVVAWIKLLDKQAVDFSNEAEQVVRIFICYWIERSSEKIYADQTYNSFNRREDLLGQGWATAGTCAELGTRAHKFDTRANPRKRDPFLRRKGSRYSVVNNTRFFSPKKRFKYFSNSKIHMNDPQNDDRTGYQNLKKLFLNIIESVREQFLTRFSKLRELQATENFMR